MRWPYAYVFERRDKPVDVAEITALFEVGGLLLRNPSNGRITRLSANGDQIETAEAELVGPVRYERNPVPFQWWVDDCLDVLSVFEYLPNGVVRHCYGVGQLDNGQLRSVNDVAQQRTGSLGVVVEPLHYGYEFDSDDWRTFFVDSGRLPAWPQTLACSRELLERIGPIPAG